MFTLPQELYKDIARFASRSTLLQLRPVSRSWCKAADRAFLTTHVLISNEMVASVPPGGTTHHLAFFAYTDRFCRRLPQFMDWHQHTLCENLEHPLALKYKGVLSHVVAAVCMDTGPLWCTTVVYLGLHPLILLCNDKNTVRCFAKSSPDTIVFTGAECTVPFGVNKLVLPFYTPKLGVCRPWRQPATVEYLTLFLPEKGVDEFHKQMIVGTWKAMNRHKLLITVVCEDPRDIIPIKVRDNGVNLFMARALSYALPPVRVQRPSSPYYNNPQDVCQLNFGDPLSMSPWRTRWIPLWEYRYQYRNHPHVVEIELMAITGRI
jgi:hypothetical protein